MIASGSAGIPRSTHPSWGYGFPNYNPITEAKSSAPRYQWEKIWNTPLHAVVLKEPHPRPISLNEKRKMTGWINSGWIRIRGAESSATGYTASESCSCRQGSSLYSRLKRFFQLPQSLLKSKFQTRFLNFHPMCDSGVHDPEAQYGVPGKGLPGTRVNDSMPKVFK